MIGNNDVCLDMCNLEQPLTLLSTFKMNLIDSLDYLRNNLPNTLVNIVPLGSKFFIIKFDKKHTYTRLLVPLVFQFYGMHKEWTL
jgi:hypothetical protein